VSPPLPCRDRSAPLTLLRLDSRSATDFSPEYRSGARSCLGRSFFETEAVAILTTLVSRYKIELRHEPQFAGESVAARRARLLRTKPGLTMGCVLPTLSLSEDRVGRSDAFLFVQPDSCAAGFPEARVRAESDGGYEVHAEAALSAGDSDGCAGRGCGHVGHVGGGRVRTSKR
jgi:hypothetical protein